MSESIPGGVLAMAERAPRAPALIWRSATVSYAELGEMTGRAGAELDRLALDQGAPIALRATKSPASIAMILACLRAGRPVLLASPDLGKEVFAELVGRAGCHAVLDVAEDGRVDSHALPGSPAGLPAGTCLLLTTSGSTGVPKIVPLETAAVTRFCTWAAGAFALGERRVLNYAPLNFDLCLLDIWATLSHGGCTVLVDPAFAGYPPHLLRLFAETEPQVVQGVPMLFRLLTGGDGEVEFPSVRTVLLTGDHTPLPLRRRLVRAFPEALFHNVYGCTETNDSFIHTFGAEEAAGREVLPLGRPLPGVAAAVLAGGRMLDGAGTGELVVSTPFQTAGYLGQDNSRFFRGTFDAALGERAWYRTGDLVARDADGALSLVGRNDFQVKVRGVRVNLEEIEQVLASHADVGEAAVVPLPDDEAGVRLHAVVRPVRDGLSSLRLRAYCADRLTRAAIPAGFSMTDEPLPTGPTGKVHRGRIRDRLVRELT